MFLNKWKINFHITSVESAKHRCTMELILYKVALKWMLVPVSAMCYVITSGVYIGNLISSSCTHSKLLREVMHLLLLNLLNCFLPVLWPGHTRWGLAHATPPLVGPVPWQRGINRDKPPEPPVQSCKSFISLTLVLSTRVLYQINVVYHWQNSEFVAIKEQQFSLSSGLFAPCKHAFAVPSFSKISDPKYFYHVGKDLLVGKTSG